MLPCIPDRIDRAIMAKYVEATKEDLALNNYVMRAKPLVHEKYERPVTKAQKFEAHNRLHMLAPAPPKVCEGFPWRTSFGGSSQGEAQGECESKGEGEG